MNSSSLDSKEEFQRQIDHQIQQIRHYENRGERILRIFLASLGLIVTGSGIIFSTSGASTIYIYILPFNYINEDKANQLISFLANQLQIAEPGAALVLFIVIIGGMILTALAFSVLFILGLYETWMVIKPSATESTALPIEEGRIVADYKEILEKNGTILNEKRDGLERALKLITTSVGLFFTGLFMLIIPVAFVSPEMAIMSLLLILWLVVATGYQRLSLSTVLDHAKPVRNPDIGLILVFLMSSAGILTDPLSVEREITKVLMWISMAIAIFGNATVDYIRLKKYWIRNFSIFIFTFFIMVFTEISINQVVWPVNSVRNEIMNAIILASGTTLIGSTIAIIAEWVVIIYPADKIPSLSNICTSLPETVIELIPIELQSDDE